LRVNLGAPGDHDRVRAHGVRPSRSKAQRLVKLMGDERAGGGEGLISAHDDDLASGQEAADRLESLAAHDERLAHRRRLESLEVARKPPEKPVVAADHAVARDSGDQDERRSIRRHTATFALIAGHGS
jgi:hypothetical protein